MIIQVDDRHFGFKEFKISLVERLKLKLGGKIYVFHARKDDWYGKLPFYIIKCDRCGCYLLDYPHGRKKYFLCPRCDRVAGVTSHKRKREE